jgi:hypothetical protein
VNIPEYCHRSQKAQSVACVSFECFGIPIRVQYLEFQGPEAVSNLTTCTELGAVFTATSGIGVAPPGNNPRTKVDDATSGAATNESDFSKAATDYLLVLRPL